VLSGQWVRCLQAEDREDACVVEAGQVLLAQTEQPVHSLLTGAERKQIAWNCDSSHCEKAGQSGLLALGTVMRQKLAV